MARAHEVAIGADARDFDHAIKTDVIKPVDEAAKSLDDLSDAAQDAGRDGARDLGKLEDAIKDVVRESDRAGREVGTNIDKGMSHAKKTTSEFKTEAAANFSEVTSSFDGSMSSIQDLAQGTLGGLASSDLPGVGIAAGIAATAVGLIGSAFQAAEDKRKLLEERANDLAQAYIEAGGQVLDALTVADRTADILTDPERRKEAEEFAKTLGGDLPLAVRALAGDTAALTQVQALAAAAQERNNDLSFAAIKNTGKRKSGISDEVQANQKLIDKTEELTQIQKNATITAKIQSDVNFDLINSTKGATKEVDKFGNELYTLPDGKQILVKADTRQATTNVEDFKGDVDGIKEKVTTTVTARVGIDDSALRNYRPKVVNIPGRIVLLPGSTTRGWQ